LGGFEKEERGEKTRVRKGERSEKRRTKGEEQNPNSERNFKLRKFYPLGAYRSNKQAGNSR
jgi:hypothetical protein